jgi:hypothetical protein
MVVDRLLKNLCRQGRPCQVSQRENDLLAREGETKRKKKGRGKMSDTRRLLVAISLFLALVFLWRGVWNLIDVYFLPEHPAWSTVASLAIGLSIPIILCFIGSRVRPTRADSWRPDMDDMDRPPDSVTSCLANLIS